MAKTGLKGRGKLTGVDAPDVDEDVGHGLAGLNVEDADVDEERDARLAVGELRMRFGDDKEGLVRTWTTREKRRGVEIGHDTYPAVRFCRR